MLDRFKEPVFWLQDIIEHLRVSQRRKTMRQPGKGTDYSQEKDVIRRTVASLHPKRMQLRVVDIIQTTPTTKTFRFERIDGPLPPFRPGQYINLFVTVDGIQTSRPYSIASPPDEHVLELSVKDNPGGFVAPYLLHDLSKGDELETSGPAGSFYYEPLIDGNDLVFLAGGSGITPFMSIINDLVPHNPSIKIHLIYGNRHPNDVIYGNELSMLSDSNPNFKYSLVISEPPEDYQGFAGFIDSKLIRYLLGEVADKTYYICGPSAMYDFCLTALSELGIPSFKIKRELYGPPADVTHQPGWPEGLLPETVFNVDVLGVKSIRAIASEPLMNTLERYGIVVPAICRVGECSACRIQLLSGSVFMPADTGIRSSDREHGYIHACVAYPLDDLDIRIS
jgi:ferredoxin-NADP reductase/ferredoxin